MLRNRIAAFVRGIADSRDELMIVTFGLAWLAMSAAPRVETVRTMRVAEAQAPTTMVVVADAHVERVRAPRAARAPIATVAPIAPVAPVAPVPPVAPVASLAPAAPMVSVVVTPELDGVQALRREMRYEVVRPIERPAVSASVTAPAAKAIVLPTMPPAVRRTLTQRELDARVRAAVARALAAEQAASAVRVRVDLQSIN